MTVYSHKRLPGFPFSEQIVHNLLLCLCFLLQY